MHNVPVPHNLNMSSASSNVSSSNTSFLDYRAYTRLSEKPIPSAECSALNGSSGTAQDNDNFLDDPTNSSSIMKWTMLNNMYPNLGAFGGPTCIFPTKSCYVIGTSKGAILIFSTRQLLLNRLVPQITGEPSARHLRSPVENIVVSSDGTHLAASYHSGDCFLWNLNADTFETNAEDVSGENEEISPLRAILHITNHRGYEVNGIGFSASRHTALIISDSSGGVFYHSGFRTHLWSLTYSSKQILNISSGEMLLASQTVPNIEGQDPLHMVAVLTTSRFAIISTAPRLSTLYLQNLKPMRSMAHSLSGCLSWHENASRVAFSLEGEIVVFKIKDTSTFSVEKSSCKFNERVSSLKWLTEDLLGVLTISYQFFVVDFSIDSKIVANFDFLVHDLLTPPHKHFAICCKKLLLLTNYGLKIGKFATWSDIVLNHVQTGDYIGALKFTKSLLREYVPLWPVIRLTKDIAKRERELVKPFYNLALAALRFVITQQDAEYDRVYELLSLVFSTVDLFHDVTKRQEPMNDFLEKSMNFFTKKNVCIFYEVLMDLIVEGSLTTLPAVVFKAMLTDYANKEKLSIVEDMVVMLDPDTLDIDLAVKLCQNFALFGVLVYIWNKIFDDYILPLADAVLRINDRVEETVIFKTNNRESVNCIFDYLSFILTGRQYPQNVPILPIEKQIEAKASLYYMLFSGTCIEWPPKSDKKLCTRTNSEHEPAFPYFNLLMNFNVTRMLSMLNEIFEDSLLNEGNSVSCAGKDQGIQVTRQYMIDVILDMMKEKTSHKNKALMAIFVACNIAKYPQFIKLSSRAMERVITTICEEDEPNLASDSQRALECLLSVHIPANTEKFIAVLKEKKFKRILFLLYIKTKKLLDILLLALDSVDTNLDYNKDFPTIIRFVLSETENDYLEHTSITNLIRANFDVLVTRLGPREAANIFEKFDPELHQSIELISQGRAQQVYLEELYSCGILESNETQHLKNLYFELSCKYEDRNTLLTWLDEIDLRNLNTERATNLLLLDKNYEAAAVIHRRLQDNTMVVEDMISCIIEWFKQGSQHYETLNKYLDVAVEGICCSNEKRQTNWTKLIACLMKLYGTYKGDPSARNSCNRAFQELFVRLAMSEASNKGGKQSELWNILTGALEHQEVIMMKAQDLRALLFDVLAAYEIEWHISKIILKIIQKSSVGVAKLYEDTLKEGWSIANNDCEICGKRLWGLGLSTSNFIIWEERRFSKENEISDLSTDNIILVSFGCHHLFHKKCLQNLGQGDGKYTCLTCNTE